MNYKWYYDLEAIILDNADEILEDEAVIWIGTVHLCLVALSEKYITKSRTFFSITLLILSLHVILDI